MKFTERFQAAYKAWQVEEPAATIRDALRSSSVKAAIPYQTIGGGGEWTWPGWSGYRYANTNLNYRQEAGDLGGSSLVMAAVNWMGTTLPEAPLQVLQRKSAKVFEPLDGHPLVELLNYPTRYLAKDDSVRQWYAGELLWKAFAFSWLIDGNVYFRKVRNSSGQVIQLWYEPHFSIRPRWPQDGSEFISYYEVERNGRWWRVETDDVIHFRYGVDPNNDRLGLSPVASLYREIFTDNERARYSALILRNGGVIPFILSPAAGSTVGLKAEEIKAEWEYRTTRDNIGRPIVLQGAVAVQEIGASPDKLLVDKASAIPEERVAAVLGIPAAVLGFGVGLDQTKVGATMRELREQAYESFLIPSQRLIAAELNAQLLPEFGDVSNLKVQHDLSQVRVLQEDREKLFKREIDAYQGDVKTRAETRSALGLDTTPEDEVYFSEWKAALAPKPEIQAPDDDAPQLTNGKDREAERLN